MALRIDEIWLAASPASIARRDYPLLVLGHQNFAHHIWNELAGLEKWLSACAGNDIGRLAICAIYEPLGPIEAILPTLTGSQIYRARAHNLFGASKSLATRIGSTQVSTTIRLAVTRFARRSAVTPQVSSVLSTIEGHSPIFWVTARLKNRTCINQRQFIMCLLSSIERSYPNSYSLIDGFSFPDDFENPSYDPIRSRLINVSEEVTSFVNSVIDSSCKAGYCRSVNVSGVRLSESLSLAEHADYYIAHAGTIQHKVGWLYNIPGYIHTCSSGLTPGAQLSYGGQVEDGVVPSVAPACFITDVPPPTPDVPNRDFNYEIKSIHEMVAHIIKSAQIVLGGA